VTLISSPPEAARDDTIILFPENAEDWRPGSPRISASSPTDGTAVFLGLLPGAYRIAVVSDVERGQWFNADFLRTLAPGADAITLSPGDRVRRELRGR
jgi:hypothetical protein